MLVITIFSDKRTLFGLTNFWNVVSNVPFVTIGVVGMLFTLKKTNFSFFLNCFVFFLGIFLTGIGSGYYHLEPTNTRLLWDRLPMTISFMAFFSIIIGDCININSGRKTLFPFLFIGVLSLVYWQITDYFDCCDLRLYVLVQYLPVILIPFILLMHKSLLNIKPHYWLMLLAYVFAKFFETTDVFIFNSTQLISGHTIKHIVSSFAPMLFFNALKKSNSRIINF